MGLPEEEPLASKINQSPLPEGDPLASKSNQSPLPNEKPSINGTSSLFYSSVTMEIPVALTFPFSSEKERQWALTLGNICLLFIKETHPDILAITIDKIVILNHGKEIIVIFESPKKLSEQIIEEICLDKNNLDPIIITKCINFEMLLVDDYYEELKKKSVSVYVQNVDIQNLSAQLKNMLEIMQSLVNSNFLPLLKETFLQSASRKVSNKLLSIDLKEDSHRLSLLESKKDSKIIPNFSTTESIKNPRNQKEKPLNKLDFSFNTAPSFLELLKLGFLVVGTLFGIWLAVKNRSSTASSGNFTASSTPGNEAQVIDRFSTNSIMQVFSLRPNFGNEIERALSDFGCPASEIGMREAFARSKRRVTDLDTMVAQIQKTQQLMKQDETFLETNTLAVRQKEVIQTLASLSRLCSVYIQSDLMEVFVEMRKQFSSGEIFSEAKFAAFKKSILEISDTIKILQDLEKILSTEFYKSSADSD